VLTITRTIRIPDEELDFAYIRSSGPGGQNVNKVSSKAVLTWQFAQSVALTGAVRSRFENRYARRITREGCVVISSQKYREQSRNAEECRAKLKAMIEAIVAAPVERRLTEKTHGSHRRRLEEKRNRSAHKQGRRKLHPE
jgi:ribosome-associated protein